MKNLKRIFIILVLIVIYVYICNITLMPNSIILMQGETLSINTLFGLGLINSQTMQTSSSLNDQVLEQTGKLDLNLNLFNLFSVKDVTVEVIPKTTVIPLGKAIGMKLYTEGVLVVGMSEIEGQKPYQNSGIETGDKIIYYTEKGKKEYKVVVNEIIYQTDWSYIENTEDNRITLITCVENMYEYRRCVQAVEII